ncbi:MAG: BlaI/MecI/CopY family transcriptional regulator [Planctomycetes bacterium]|nr:BlaI/MecI/CopY family transcriptional regulator [Planctomycetota bacterium]
MAEKSPELSAAELEVINVLWDEGPLTVRQVHAHLHRAGRKIAYTTVLTFLSRLEQKEVVVSDKSGLAYVYRPALSRERVRKSRLKSLVTQLYDGAAGELVLQLIKTQHFSTDEIEQLRELVERLDRKGRQGDRESED